MLKILLTACLLVASAKNPYTVSVGQMTTPPFFKIETAFLRAWSDFFTASIFYKIRKFLYVFRATKIHPVIRKFFGFHFFVLGQQRNGIRYFIFAARGFSNGKNRVKNIGRKFIPTRI